MSENREIRNVAIIAHVDHGKTTLVDQLLKSAGTFRPGQDVTERVMDSNDLERERGITILSKCTSITWNGVQINLVDTPGHADFGGEVERVLGMVDAVLLVVDAVEGPMPQTRFVTSKAFELGHKALVCVNKIDRAAGNPDKAIDGVFDLFDSLGASDDQLDFPTIYASAKEGYARNAVEDTNDDMLPLLEMLVRDVPKAKGDLEAPFCMQVATLDYDDFLGYVAIGRVVSGTCRVGDRLAQTHPVTGRDTEFRVQKVLGFQGLKRFEMEVAEAGNIIALTGMTELSVGDTLSSVSHKQTLPALTVDEPTIRMTFRPNDGPFGGKEGKYVTSRHLRDRLLKETKSNIALRVEEGPDAGQFQVSGRGELHLAVLIEEMRREGFELCVSQPQVIFKEDESGKRTEPFELAVIELDEDYSGTVIQEMNRRLGILNEMGPAGTGRTRLEFRIPARGLIGYRSQFLTDTRGTGVLYTQFDGYEVYAGDVRSRINGVLIAQDTGKSNAYALFTLQERGAMIIGPGVDVYGGMVVGIHSRGNDLVVNPTKAKKLSNIRTTSADEKLILSPPKEMTLEMAMEFINADELVEITPSAIRIRKTLLDHNDRKRIEKANKPKE